MKDGSELVLVGGQTGNGAGGGEGRSAHDLRALDREARIEWLVRELLFVLGEDPGRQGLKDTPNRIARMYRELLAGNEADVEALVNGALFDIKQDDMIVVKGIGFHSLCEHHMLPFFGHAHIAYLPGEKVIGLSKIPRIVEMYARRLQVQERLGLQIADQLEETLQPQGVAVVIDGMHLCTAMRGVRQEEARMRTRVMRGVFKEDGELRREFVNQLSSERGA